MDFESATIKILQKLFVGAPVVGCPFNFSQSGGLDQTEDKTEEETEDDGSWRYWRDEIQLFVTYLDPRG